MFLEDVFERCSFLDTIIKSHYYGDHDAPGFGYP
ncbi:hypothetical protein A359_08400 [secondary endosymbiont of Ctenarytaina eucalypti]|uniref:Uncharacterized protein n=1 Tax=secondary endosymbiont of Ctenarytaina eucalypti TaxID=1199245 RepID=J3VTB3_9ENTR|nr:hypothetical protein A359_08400 [secondary endosymbiont of Ctenarytaina eucalypti]